MSETDASNIPPLTDSDMSENDDDTEDEIYKSDDDSSSQEPPTKEGGRKAPAKSAGELRSEGNKVFGEGKYDQAIVHYQDATNASGCSADDRVKCFSNIAHCHNKKQQYGQAVEFALKAIELQPTFVRAFSRLAESYTFLEKHTLAALTLHKGMAHNSAEKQLKEQLSKIK